MFKCPADLALSFSVLAEVVHEMEVGFAPAANQRVLIPNLPEERARVEITSRALNIDAFMVQVHVSFA
jgi:hypothetical protein